MPVTIKSAYIKYKDGQGQYVGIDSVAETSTAEQVAAIEAKGEEVLESIPAGYSALAAAVGGKADKVSSAANNNFAALDANGNLKDSGHKHSDYLTAHQDISGTLRIPGISTPTTSQRWLWKRSAARPRPSRERTTTGTCAAWCPPSPSRRRPRESST